MRESKAVVPLGGTDGTCEVPVTTSGGDISLLVSEAASESVWVVVSGEDRPTWTRGGVTVTCSVDVHDDKSGNVLELEARRSR